MLDLHSAAVSKYQRPAEDTKTNFADPTSQSPQSATNSAVVSADQDLYGMLGVTALPRRNARAASALETETSTCAVGSAQRCATSR